MKKGHKRNEWTPEAITLLRKLTDKGKTAAEIGEVVGRTKICC